MIVENLVSAFPIRLRGYVVCAIANKISVNQGSFDPSTDTEQMLLNSQLLAFRF